MFKYIVAASILTSTLTFAQDSVQEAREVRVRAATATLESYKVREAILEAVKSNPKAGTRITFVEHGRTYSIVIK